MGIVQSIYDAFGFEETPTRLPADSEIRILSQLQSSMQKKMSKDDTEIRVLEKIWKAAIAPSNPDIEFTLKSEKWREHLGFQRDEPLSDFRGGGELSAQCLLYIVTSDAGKEVMKKADRRREKAIKELNDDEYASYPFAPAIINLTRFVASLYNVCNEHGQIVPFTELSSPYYSTLKNTTDFYHAVMLALIALDDQWTQTNVSRGCE